MPSGHVPSFPFLKKSKYSISPTSPAALLSVFADFVRWLCPAVSSSSEPLFLDPLHHSCCPAHTAGCWFPTLTPFCPPGCPKQCSHVQKFGNNGKESQTEFVHLSCDGLSVSPPESLTGHSCLVPGVTPGSSGLFRGNLLSYPGFP